MIKVSVILPVYNAEQYLNKCIDSILNQSLRDIEVVCVDDGSTDSTIHILQKYAERDVRVKLLKQKNGGAGAARNAGMKLACGEYLLFLDADDFFEPAMLEKAYNQCKNNEADFCVFRSDEYDNQTGHFSEAQWTINKKYLPTERPFSSESVSKYVFQLFNGWAWDKLYKHSFVEENGLLFQEQRTTNDAFFVFMSTIRAKRIEIVDEVLVHHRVNVKTSLSMTREKSWVCAWAAVDAMRNEMQEKEQYEKFEQSFLNFALHFFLWNYHTLHGDSKENFQNALLNEYIPALQFDAYGKNYYYNSVDYAQLLAIKKDRKIRFQHVAQLKYYRASHGTVKTIKKVLAKLF